MELNCYSYLHSSMAAAAALMIKNFTFSRLVARKSHVYINFVHTVLQLASRVVCIAFSSHLIDPTLKIKSVGITCQCMSHHTLVSIFLISYERNFWSLPFWVCILRILDIDDIKSVGICLLSLPFWVCILRQWDLHLKYWF